MKKQETFEFVARHLFTQGVKAVDPAHGRCMYRGQNKTTCAVGCLIPDEVYETSMENRRVLSLMSSFGDVLPKFFSRQIDLLGALQAVHDDSPDSRFTTAYLRSRLKMVGRRYSLRIGFFDDLEVSA